MQMKTPRLMLAHLGFLVGQSAQMALSGFFTSLSSIRMCLLCCSSACLLIVTFQMQSGCVCVSCVRGVLRPPGLAGRTCVGRLSRSRIACSVERAEILGSLSVLPACRLKTSPKRRAFPRFSRLTACTQWVDDALAHACMAPRERGWGENREREQKIPLASWFGEIPPGVWQDGSDYRKGRESYNEQSYTTMGAWVTPWKSAVFPRMKQIFLAPPKQSHCMHGEISTTRDFYSEIFHVLASRLRGGQGKKRKKGARRNTKRQKRRATERLDSS